MPAKQQTSLAAREKNKAEERSVYVMVVEDGDKRYSFRNVDLGPADRLACRQQTGISLQEVLMREDTDTPLFIIWLARRKSGEPNLPFNQVLAKYPTDVDAARLNFHVEDEDGNEVEVADDDPLPESG